MGKVPLINSFNYFFKSREDKLKDIIYYGNIFKVYFYAKKNLEENSKISTQYREVYIFDDYFEIVLDRKKSQYNVGNNCAKENIIYQAGQVSLCKNK
jgi:hypothetical protein